MNGDDVKDQGAKSAQTESGRLRTLLVDIAAGVVFWCPGMALSLAVLLDKLTPGQLLPAVVSLLALIWLGVAIAVIRLKHRPRQLVERKPKRRLTRRDFIVILALLAVLLTAYLGVYLHDSKVDHSLLESAELHFLVVKHGDISQNQVDGTLIELERAWQRLDQHLGSRGNQVFVQVHLFPSLSDYHNYDSLPHNSTGCTQCLTTGPVIYLPASGAGATSSPPHEAVHAVVCSLLGREVMESLPLWFNEGLANYETGKGFNNLFERDRIRLTLWLDRGDLMIPDKFGSYVLGESTEEVSIFYSSSYEFMRYIAKAFGDRSPWDVLEKVANGMTFDNAFMNVTGHDWRQTYREWLNAF